MAWAEAHWLGKIAGVPNPITQPTYDNGMSLCGTMDTFDVAAIHTDKIIAALHHDRVHKNIEPDCSDTPFDNLDACLQHLAWHWTYHSGQIGLLRKFLGHEYQWQFADK